MALAALRVRIQGSGFDVFKDATEALGSTSKANRALGRAINHTGAKAFTGTKRALAKQTGLTQKKLKDKGGLGKSRARANRLEFTIYSSGRALSLKEFGAKQFKFGVKAKPWGTVTKFRGAFINTGTPKSGNPFAGGHVFIRTSGDSFPVRKMFGPAVPNEMVKNETKDAFEAKARGLNDRLAHEVGRMTGGAVS